MLKLAALRHPWGWSSLVPVACAIHCLAGPLLVILLPAAVFSERAEWLLLAAATGVAFVALAVGIRSHGRWHVVALATVGILVWTGSLGELFGPAPEELTTAAGSLLLAGALLRNSRLQCHAPEGTCEACTVTESSAKEGAELLTTPQPLQG